MASTGPQAERIRFGEFELNLRTRELTNNGSTADLQEQPFLVLTALLADPGELVLREQLIQRLWPADTHVDFERSLNKAVKRLREALNDSADRPRFVETLPRRGYRFIGTVRTESGTQPVSSSPVEPHRTDGVQVEREGGTQLRKRMRSFAIGGGILSIVVAAGLVWLQFRRAPTEQVVITSPSIRSLVVLPLENLSGEAAQEYFADAMTDELTTDLGQIGSLRVVSRTSAMHYKKTSEPLKQIAGELGVDAVVEGSVLRSGDRVRITAQLIEAQTDRHLWAQSYEGDAKDALGLQNQVAKSIADQIRVKLTPEQRAALNASRPVIPAAHEMYLRGFYEKKTIQGRTRALEDFKRAAALDPNYATAQVAIGRQYEDMGHILFWPPQKAFPPAIEAIHKALELDASLADAHLVAGDLAFLYEWDFPKSEREILRALELNPNLAIGYEYYAEWLIAMGRGDEGIAQQRRCLELDPLSIRPRGVMSGLLYWTRHFDQALAEAKSVLTIDDNSIEGHVYLGLSLEAKQEYPEAIREMERAKALLGDESSWMGFAAHARAMAGDRHAALKALDELEHQSKRGYVSPWWSALIYTGLGDKDKAFEYLEKSYQGREHDLVFSKVWPQFDPLHSDPRWADLMRRVGLPE
jgi:TolB-like protein/DNA-binding winged helix-turn-helix (wHTH) protein